MHSGALSVRRLACVRGRCPFGGWRANGGIVRLTARRMALSAWRGAYGVRLCALDNAYGTARTLRAHACPGTLRARMRLLVPRAVTACLYRVRHQFISTTCMSSSHSVIERVFGHRSFFGGVAMRKFASGQKQA
eukprot:3289459-Pleurochrysis_carterae.AAC.1